MIATLYVCCPASDHSYHRQIPSRIVLVKYLVFGFTISMEPSHNVGPEGYLSSMIGFIAADDKERHQLKVSA